MANALLPPSSRNLNLDRIELSPTERPAGLPSEAAVLGRMGGENFPVALRVLPGRARRRLVAIYGFARFVDEIGDSYPGDRLGALAWLAAEVAAARGDEGDGSGNREGTRAGEGSGAGVHPLVAAAVDTAVSTGAGTGPLEDLIAANVADQGDVRYATFEELLGYCRLSADPVGRLVLAAFDVALRAGAHWPQMCAWSDSICSGLQIVEHLQDVAEDARAGRVYLPAEDLARFGLDDVAVLSAAGAGHTARRSEPALRAVVAFEAARARRMILDGSALVVALGGTASLAVAAFAGGGLAALDALASGGFDPWLGSSGPSRGGTVRHAAQLLAHRTGRT